MTLDDVKKYKYISVDVFDTLVFRTVSEPEDIFSIVEYEYNRENVSAGIKNFKHHRIMAERRAREKNKDLDVSLEFIYEQLPYSKSICKQLKDLEESVEVKNCVPNVAMVRFIQECNQSGHTIIVTTDMYLPSRCIEKILNKINIEYQHLFVSGEVGKTKKQGELFEYILDELTISSEDIVHIGDNSVSDIANPGRYGIASLKRIIFPKKEMYFMKNNKYSIGINQMECLISNYSEIHERIETSQNIGYSVLGPAIQEFCRWIHTVKNEESIETLCFIAREGYIIKKCYEQMYPLEMGAVEYIRLNKNLIRTPMLGVISDISEIYDSFPRTTELTWKEILAAFGISDYAEIKKYIKGKFYFDENGIIERKDLIEHKYDKELILVQEYLKKEINEQTEFLIEYLEKNDLFGKKIAFVNNSINGVMQKQIENILTIKKKPIEIIGLQFVYSDTCKATLGEKVRGWLTEDKLPRHYVNDFRRNSLLFEHCLFENSGTALLFQKEDGGVSVLCDEIGEEENNWNFISGVQKAILQFISDYQSVGDIPLGSIVIDKLLLFEKKPHLADLKELSQLYDKDIDGTGQMIDKEIGFSAKILLGGKRIPSSIKWVEGYLTCKNVKYLKIYSAINCIRDNKLDMREWGKYIVYRMTLNLRNKVDKDSIKNKIIRKLNLRI